MKVDVTVPGVGESITEGTIGSWSVADGSAVIEGQALFELETDKTTIDVTAPATGTLSILVAEGTDVTIDQVVARIDTEGSSKAAGPAEGKESAPVAPPPEAADPSGTGAAEAGESSPNAASTRITPAARSAAAAAGIDPAGLKGSGRGGTVTKDDVMKAAEASPASVDAAAAASTGESSAPDRSRPAPPVPSKSAAGETGSPDEMREPLSRIRRVIAANLERTRDELVLLTTFNEADMSGIKALRSRYGERFRERHGVKLGFMSFFLKASAAALEAFPDLNAYIDGDQIVRRRGVHISVAVSTPKGLVTPVIRNVAGKGFAELETEIGSFARRAEEKTLRPEDLSGGTFTVTNGGVFGSMMSTPLPAPKQSAILGMHAIIDRPVAVDGAVEIRPMMYLALSYDHRLVDGREAVGCLKAIKDAVEHPERLLLEL